MEDSKVYLLKTTLILWHNRYVNADHGNKFRTDRRCHTWYCGKCNSEYYSAKLVRWSELPDVCPSCGSRMKFYSVVKKSSV